jgi:hypothetical protein
VERDVLAQGNSPLSGERQTVLRAGDVRAGVNVPGGPRLVTPVATAISGLVLPLASDIGAFSRSWRSLSGADAGRHRQEPENVKTQKVQPLSARTVQGLLRAFQYHYPDTPLACCVVAVVLNLA